MEADKALVSLLICVDSCELYLLDNVMITKISCGGSNKKLYDKYNQYSD